MSAFKDMVREDIKNVFLDLDMFGEKHVVAGKEMTIVLDDAEKLRRNELYQDNKAIYSERIFFYAAADDFKQMPVLGRTINIDGREYKILQAEQEDGMFAVMAEEFRG